jgi:YD repeat-containing protein
VDYSYDEFGEKVSMTTYRNVNGGTGNEEQGTGNGAVQGDVTRWLRDEATGLVTNKVYADGKGPRYDYTPDGKLATRTWARGIVTTYSYDDNGALTNTVYSDGTPTISLAYNRAGRSMEFATATPITVSLVSEPNAS